MFDTPFGINLRFPNGRKGFTLDGFYRNSIDLGFASLTKYEANTQTKDGPAIFLDTTAGQVSVGTRSSS
jgi:hypothetical protein